MDQDHYLWWLLFQMRRAMHKARTKELQQYDITVEEAAVLHTTRAIGYAATPSEISRWLLREPHSTGGILIRMEKKGLVRRIRDLDRKNLVRIEITDKGQQVYEKSLKRESIHRIMAILSAEDRQKLCELSEALWSRTLEEFGMRYRPPYPQD